MLIIQSSLTRAQILMNCLCLVIACYRYAFNVCTAIHTDDHMHSELYHNTMRNELQRQRRRQQRHQAMGHVELSKRIIEERKIKIHILEFWFRFSLTPLPTQICIVLRYCLCHVYALLLWISNATQFLAFIIESFWWQKMNIFAEKEWLSWTRLRFFVRIELDLSCFNPLPIGHSQWLKEWRNKNLFFIWNQKPTSIFNCKVLRTGQISTKQFWFEFQKRFSSLENCILAINCLNPLGGEWARKCLKTDGASEMKYRRVTQTMFKAFQQGQLSALLQYKSSGVLRTRYMISVWSTFSNRIFYL